MGKTQKIIDLQNEVDNLKGQLEEKEQECKTLDGRLNGIKKIVFGEAGGDAKIARLKDAAWFGKSRILSYANVMEAKKTGDLSGILIGDLLCVAIIRQGEVYFDDFLVAEKGWHNGEAYITFIARDTSKRRLAGWEKDIHDSLSPNVRVFIPSKYQLTGKADKGEYVLGDCQFPLFQYRPDLIECDGDYPVLIKKHDEVRDAEGKICDGEIREMVYSCIGGNKFVDKEMRFRYECSYSGINKITATRPCFTI